MAAQVGAADSAMDAEFLKRTVGEPLSDALTALVVAQPGDPIEFIGEALLDFIRRREAEAKRHKHAENVAHLLKVAREQEEIARAENAAREAAVQAKSDVERQAEEAMAQASTHPELYTKALGLVKERLGASGVQLGRKVMVEGQEIVEFIAASEGREYMVGKEIKGLKEGEDPEDGEAKEEGVTFGLWKKTEQPPPAEPVYDEEGELVPDENEPELIPPEHVLIENVVRDPRVNFFGIPKLGAYLALPITYGSWLHPGGISDAPPPSENEESPDEEEVGSNEADADAAAEEEPRDRAESGGSTDEKPPKPSASLYSKNDAPVQLVLSIDTIGQGRCFTSSDILWAKSLAAKVKANVEALECRMFEDEAALIPSLRGSEVTDLVAKVTEGEETAVAEALALLEPGTPEDEKDRVTKTIQYRIKTKAVEAVGDLVSLMGKLNLAPPVAVLDVLERALLLVGKDRADLCDSRGALDWVAKMRMVVSMELVPAISAFNAEDPASAVRAGEAKEAVESMDAESVKASNVPALVVLEWMSSAITEAEDAAAAAAAAEAAAIAAAEQAAAEAAEAAEVVAAAAEEEGEED
ncbi:unnamed protein product [Ectocarpus sp. 12 AP-2014]